MSGNLAATEKRNSCFATNKRYLIVLNLIFLIMACAIIAVASWGQKNSASLQALIPPGGFSLAIAAGSILLVIALSGMAGTALSGYKFGRNLLVFYNVVLFILIILELVSAGMMAAATGNLNDYSYGSYAGSTIGSWINNSYPYCCNNSVTPAVVLTQNCFVSSFLTPANCASPSSFFSAFQTVLSNHLIPVTASLFIAVGLQIINMVITCCVICVAKKHYQKHDEEAETSGGEQYNHSDYEKRKDVDASRAPAGKKAPQGAAIVAGPPPTTDDADVELAPNANPTPKRF